MYPYNRATRKKQSPSALLAKGIFASTRWWEAGRSEWGGSWHCLCSHDDKFFKNAAFEREASSVWCQGVEKVPYGAEKPPSHS